MSTVVLKQREAIRSSAYLRLITITIHVAICVAIRGRCTAVPQLVVAVAFAAVLCASEDVARCLTGGLTLCICHAAIHAHSNRETPGWDIVDITS